jgi:hypothetical protein
VQTGTMTQLSGVQRVGDSTDVQDDALTSSPYVV